MRKRVCGSVSEQNCEEKIGVEKIQGVWYPLVIRGLKVDFPDFVIHIFSHFRIHEVVPDVHIIVVSLKF